VGCSDGFFSFSRFDNVDEWGKVYGIDKDETMVETGLDASKNKKNTYKFICKDIINLASDDNDLKSLFGRVSESEEIKFDVIILINTLHHLGTANQLKVLKYLWKYLEPGCFNN
jgi:2-polyprenyl-3-methyl-5-hydroxy-6-metoxy-1,4-benzoquinol methylase